MAKQTSVMGEVDEEFFKDLKPVPELRPSGPGFRAAELPPVAVGRGDFGDYLANQLKLGFSDLADLFITPAEKKFVYGDQPVFGFEPSQRPESLTQRMVGGAARAVPAVTLPLPIRGASLFAPGRAGAITGTLGAGAGAELGGSITEQAGFGRLPGEISGALTVGGVTQTVTDIFTGKLVNIGIGAYNRLLGELKNTLGEEGYKDLLNAANNQQMERILKENPDLLEKLSRSEELQKLIPGFAPNLFQATGAQTVRLRGLAALERQPEQIPQLANQQAQNIKALQSKVSELFPATESSYVFAGRQLDKTQSAIASLINDNDQKIQSLSKRFVKTGAQDLGAQIRDLYTSRRQATSNVFQKQYEALDADAAAKGVQLTPDSTSSIYTFVNNNRDAFEDSPQLFNLIQTRFAPKERPAGAIVSETGAPMVEGGQEFDPASFADLRSLYRQLNADFYKADQAASQNVPGAGRKAKLLSDLKTQVQANIDSLPADVKDRFYAINAAYDNDYRQVFKKGLGGALGAETRMGTKVADEDIIGKLTKESNVDDFYRIFGDTPETQEYLKAGLIDKFLKQGNALNADGTVNQAALTAFSRINEGVINKVPALQTFLAQSADELARFADERASLVKGQQALERSALRAITKKQDLDQVFTLNQSGAFQDLNRLSAIIGSAKADPNGNAIRGVQGIMMDRALSSADPVEFINKNEKAFKRAFGEQFTVVRDLAEAGQMLARNLDVVPPVKILEGDIAQQMTGTSIPGAFSLLRDRITSVPTKISILFSRFTQAKGIQEKDNAFLELYKDPAKAREALRYVKTFNSPKASEEAKALALSGLNKLLVRSGVNIYRTGLVTTMGPDEQPPIENQAPGFDFEGLQPVEE